MNRIKHTPGPWEVVENPDSGGRDTVIGNAASIYSDDETYVADVYRGYVGSESVTHDQQISNARLIAAAPCLLDALQRLNSATRRYMEERPESDAEWASDEPSVLSIVDAAIAKATGGES